MVSSQILPAMDGSIPEEANRMLPGWRPFSPGLPVRAGLTALALLWTAGCGHAGAGGSAAGTAPAHDGLRITVMARSLPGVGSVLVDAKGYALYVFAPDNHHAVTCTGACAGTWPPFMLPTGGTLVAGRGVSSMLLWTEPDPDGGRVVAYDGWPLYTYSGDVQPGQATGQDIDLNGGEWYVLRPSGQPEIAAP